MTTLRSKFIEFLELRGYAKATINNYVDGVKLFTRWLKASPLQISTDKAREYLIYLKREWRLAPRSLNIHLYALRAFPGVFAGYATTASSLYAPEKNALRVAGSTSTLNKRSRKEHVPVSILSKN
jgi:hypothetical protein